MDHAEWSNEPASVFPALEEEAGFDWSDLLCRSNWATSLPRPRRWEIWSSAVGTSAHWRAGAFSTVFWTKPNGSSPYSHFVTGEGVAGLLFPQLPPRFDLLW